MAVVEVKINGLAVDANAKSHVVILKEKDGERVLPIWIGPAEAQAIARELAGQRFQRPLTHDLLANIVEGLKAKVTRVVISELKENTFFAQLLIDRGGEAVVIDARPSDSIAVALRCGADIFVNEKLLNEPGEQDEPTAEEKAQELRKFLENLDPEDFGKYNP
jgi:bifunctional DNase/RNase